MVNLASLINIIVFYFKFGEKISAMNLIGIFLMIGCVVCISMAAANTDDSSIDEEYNPDEAFGL